MKELVEYIAKNLVDDPDSVKVEETQASQGFVSVTLEVNPQDKGKVIGRQGRVAKSMRTLLRVMAVKDDVRVNLEIL
ncbi:MAG: RNA-binding protein [Dehalococcoidia bacterium]|nr:RNA-binding protein [Dehalococcoidia bacterium]